MPSLALLRGRGGNPGAGLEPAGGAGEGAENEGMGCRRAITGDARGGAARFVAERLQVVPVVSV